MAYICKNTQKNRILVQFYILQFTIETFDFKIIEKMSGSEPIIKNLALYMGSFLMPKLVNKGLQIGKIDMVVIRDSLSGLY